MNRPDLDRLLRSAANAPEEPTLETPFGFETRVLAAWRSRQEGFNDVADLTRFLRRTGVIAFAVLVLASAAAYRHAAECLAPLREARLLEILDERLAKGATLIAATHDRRFVADATERTIALDGGWIVSDEAVP